MAALPSSPSLQLLTATISATHFPYPSAAFPIKPPKLSFTTRATTDDNKADTTQEPESKPGSAPEDKFESRLSQVRLRYRSGTGKKAELRKAKKGKSGTGSGSGMYLPPVPLKKSVSDGLKVEFGFSPYSERINGRIAILGLSALFLVELATGKGVINYHTPAIVLLQIYFVVAVAAMYVKYEKEKVSIWPQSASSKK
ncbi:hypothetical protein OIU76_013169 [Salix suchowensis]|uniref:FKBP-TYPE PEPTIDYL-PROLYL CIS-TRANS ISOMERASE n=2 Tax=Salix TaxID=40685 RepID=A0A9Q0VZX4_9ROSI|nr:Chlorophyll A-B binding protein [Salix suchowensis]KAJ6317575.1 hypothetical protein OIU76_013169 [Salix suchowensis]KAJ6322856.1 hypothetical protein OIU77_012658 [Salix suchowensis]KAJ6350159.1 hypothetical protein OIU78_006350 [Salix suchowensis]KAJ6758086.1 FKBP-TYPE PEPTIDYL-PROLYL CIS-TRANS ISOMERASE [Salix koriyanagi]